MSINEKIVWIVIASSVAGFFVASGYTIRRVTKNHGAMIEAERNMGDEYWMKFTRQDVAGVLVALFVTNGLLGAIVALLAVGLLRAP
jgi:hypothetical protein